MSYLPPKSELSFPLQDVDFSSPQSPRPRTERTSTSNEEKHNFKRSTSLQKQLSSDESTKRPTLLDEAATLVDVKPVFDNDTEM